MNDKEREYIANAVITTGEVATLLECATKTVNYYVNEEGLKILRKTTNGFLFLLEDIEEFKLKRSAKAGRNSGNIYFDRTGTTRDSLNYFGEYKGRLGAIAGVSIYFDDLDSSVDGYYNSLSAVNSIGLKKIETGYHMIIRDISGNEIWLRGCNCGYRGTGPSGSKKVLADLGLLTAEVDIAIEEYRVVKLAVDGGELKIFKRDGLKKESRMSRMKGANGTCYELHSSLVLAQNKSLYWDSDTQSTLECFQEFIPTPVEVIVFNSIEQATKYGFYIECSYKDNEAFTMIIKDASGRQLWLAPEIYGEARTNIEIKSLLELIGFAIDDVTLPDTILKWIKMNVRKVEPEPLFLRR